MIVTTHLKLIPASLAHVRAEMGDRVAFAEFIQAAVPENWPPESAADALPLFLKSLEAAPDCIGWFGWYALADYSGANRPVLVGGGGVLGPPQDGEIKIGYSVLPQFQGRGFATEMVSGLVHWALKHHEVNRILAETEWANPASVRVLSKIGFIATGSSAQPGGNRFELSRATKIALARKV